MAYIPTPKKYPKSPSASRQTGGKAKESMPGVRGSGEAASRVGLGRLILNFIPQLQICV